MSRPARLGNSRDVAAANRGVMRDNVTETASRPPHYGCARSVAEARSLPPAGPMRTNVLRPQGKSRGAAGARSASTDSRTAEHRMPAARHRCGAANSTLNAGSRLKPTASRYRLGRSRTSCFLDEGSRQTVGVMHVRRSHLVEGEEGWTGRSGSYPDPKPTTARYMALEWPGSSTTST